VWEIAYDHCASKAIELRERHHHLSMLAPNQIRREKVERERKRE
jgi:hypothetical protein